MYYKMFIESVAHVRACCRNQRQVTITYVAVINHLDKFNTEVQMLVEKVEQSIGIENCLSRWVVLGLKLDPGFSRVMEKRGTIVESRNKRRPWTESKKGA